MIRTLVVASCLFTVVAASSAASAQQEPLQAPAISSPAQGDLFLPKPVYKCGSYCGPGGTTSTLSSFGGAGNCAPFTADLTTRLTAAANASCQNLTGRTACNIVFHFSGCLPDGDVQYWIEYGWATYGCRDTTC